VGALGNLIVALGVWFLSKDKGELVKKELPTVLAPLTLQQKLLLGISFLSGFYLICLQTVWVRLVGLASGTSHYSFSTVVFLFILGLGWSSLAIKKIHRIKVNHLILNQAVVTILLILIYFSVDQWSYNVHLIRVLFRDIPQSFWAYQFALMGFWGSLFIIPLGFAGLVLPLCFHLYKDSSDSLGFRVGQVYGINTLGCMAGALGGGYFLFSFLNLDQVFKVCIFASWLALVISLALAKKRNYALSLSGLVVLAAIIIWAPQFNRERFTQPFRNPNPIPGVTGYGAEAFGKYISRSTEYLLNRDGQNTTVGIGISKYGTNEISRTIFVNGKSDGNTRGDLLTTVMIAHLPALLSPKVEKVAVIGFGTGVTVGTLAQNPEVKSVDVSEISGTIIENAHHFDTYNAHASSNPKVKFHEMDAFRFFASEKDNFDVIVSEPSNPWVLGVENLYTKEFYHRVTGHLSAKGSLVQWIHTYSFSEDLFQLKNTYLTKLRF
jgi:hypothetical protein